MATGPIISIFRPGGGPAVAEGILVKNQNGEHESAGLFSPWPKALTKDAEFSIYVPGSEGKGEEWLSPGEVGVLEHIDEQDRTAGVVSFTSLPSRREEGSEGSFEQPEFDAIQTAENSRWAAVKAYLADDLKRLAELERHTPTAQLVPPAGVSAIPQERHVARAAEVSEGDFFCRYLLRWD